MSQTVNEECEYCDMRKENKEFCTMWGCRCFNVDYCCTSCPVLTDLKNMANAFHIRFQLAEPSISSKAA